MTFGGVKGQKLGHCPKTGSRSRSLYRTFLVQGQVQGHAPLDYTERVPRRSDVRTTDVVRVDRYCGGGGSHREQGGGGNAYVPMRGCDVVQTKPRNYSER